MSSMAKHNEETVIIDVAPDGTTIIEVEGVVGPGCEALSRPFEERLGFVNDRSHKPEYNQTEKQTQRQQQKRKQ